MSPRATAILSTARILWGALVASTFILLVVLFVARPKDAIPPPFVIQLGALAIANAVIAAVLPTVQYRNFARKREFELAVDPQGQRIFANPSTVIETLAPMYQTALILGMAMAESVALLGFVLVYLGHPFEVAIPFFAVCWGLQISKFPTFAKVAAPVVATTGAKFQTT